MKRVLLFVITAVLCLSLFACTSSQQSETTSGTVKAETAETEEKEEIITTAEPDTTAPDITTASARDITTMGDETVADVTAAETTADITVPETTVAETAPETTVAETKKAEETYTYITTKKVEHTTSPSDTESPEETETAEVSLSSCLAELGVRTSANASLVAYKQIAENNVDVIVIVNRDTDALLTTYKYDGTKLSEVSSASTNKITAPSQNPYVFVFGYTLWEG